MQIAVYTALEFWGLRKTGLLGWDIYFGEEGGTLCAQCKLGPVPIGEAAMNVTRRRTPLWDVRPQGQQGTTRCFPRMTEGASVDSGQLKQAMGRQNWETAPSLRLER